MKLVHRRRSLPALSPRIALLLAALLVILSACSMLAPPAPSTTASGDGEPVPTLTLTPTLTPSPTSAPIVLPTPLATSTLAQSPTPTYTWFTGEVRVFPGPRHYDGDLLSVEVAISNPGEVPANPSATLSVDNTPVDVKPFVAYSPLRSDVLVFRWAWDSTGQGGAHQFAVHLDPINGAPAQDVAFRVAILPAKERPKQEKDARWVSRPVGCCVLNYVTNTAADRDIDTIAAEARQAAADVQSTLHVSMGSEQMPVTLLANMWGNGGYTSTEVVVSYLDRAYTTPNFSVLLRHEMTHWAMRNRLSPGTPALLSEGLAVYVAGGHYKIDPIPERAAALLALGDYVPLATMADDFWSQQHEIAYVESAGLVSYLIETYGLDTFLKLYTSEGLQGPGGSAWFDEALRRATGRGLEHTEADYKAWLASKDPGDQVQDLQLTIDLYNTIRRYEDVYAPYQESLPSSAEARSAGQVAEFMRGPTEVYNVALEAMFVSVQHALLARQYPRAQALLAAVNATLADGNFTRDIVATYIDIITTLSDSGYEAQTVDIQGEQAVVTAIRRSDWPLLRTLTLTFDGTNWVLSN